MLGLAGATVVLLTAFLIRESRTPEPMLELELLRRPSFAAIAVVAFGITASLVAATTYMALYLINTLGLTPFETGLRFLPLTGASFIAAPVAARLSQRVAPAILVPSGAVLIAIGMWTMTGLDVGSDWTHLLPGSIIAGVGLGVTSAVLSQAALAAVPPARAGMATGAANTFRQIGVAAGVAGLGALFAHRVGSLVNGGLTGAGVPAQSASDIADAVASGAGVQVAQAVPVPMQQLVADTAHLASASGLNLVLITGTVIAAASAVIAVALLVIRPRAAAPPLPQPPPTSADGRCCRSVSTVHAPRAVGPERPNLEHSCSRCAATLASECARLGASAVGEGQRFG